MKLVALAVISVIAVSSYVGSVAADVPVIVSIENVSNVALGFGPATVIIKVTISLSKPSSSHYVDLVQVDIGGTVRDYPLKPQSSNPFTVSLTLGQYGPPQIVNVRAHCSTGGWSDWSGPIPVPEFPVAAIVAFLALLASLVLTRNGAKYLKRR